VIESSQKSEKRMVSSEEKTIDSGEFQNVLRPKKLDDYVGQTIIKKHLMVSISSAKIRGESLDHILFY
jgi:Holliday junction DNA helicase RuvB